MMQTRTGWPMLLKLAMASLIGGFAGCVARGATEWLFVQELHMAPWTARVCVNLVGALGMGIFFASIARLDERGLPDGVPHDARLREHLIGAGFFGGLTTVSGFAFDLVAVAESGSAALPATILVMNGLVGIAGCAFGFWLGLRARHRRGGHAHEGRDRREVR